MPRRFENRLAAGAVFALCAALVCANLGCASVANAAGPESTAAKADKLPLPLASEPAEDYPVTAGTKADREPVLTETTKRKSIDTVSANDRLTPAPPDPDRLSPLR